MDEKPSQDGTDSLETRVEELETQTEKLSTDIREVWTVLIAGLLILVYQTVASELVMIVSIPVGFYVIYLLFRRFTDAQLS